MGRAPMVKTSRQDAADAGGGALVGLDVGGVVVALHLEDHRQTIADIHHARVLAGAADDLRAGGGQGAEPFLGRLVRTMFVPQWPRRCRSSVKLGSRPMISRMRSYSSGVSPWAAISSGVMAGSVMACPPFGRCLRQAQGRGKGGRQSARRKVSEVGRS